MNNATDLTQYRESLLAKQRELLTAIGGRVVLAPAGGLAGALEDGAGARIVTVSPRPSIPLSSRGWMPYAIRNRRGA